VYPEEAEQSSEEARPWTVSREGVIVSFANAKTAFEEALTLIGGPEPDDRHAIVLKNLTQGLHELTSAVQVDLAAATLKLNEIEQRLRRIEMKHSLMPESSKV
jgi:hypothetical protein